MAWTRIDITEACLLGGTYHRLCRRFQQAFIAAGAPDDMALFAQTFPVGDTRTLFLTPASQVHLGAGELDELRTRGEACAAPPAQEVTLVFGVPDAKHRLLGPLALGPDALDDACTGAPRSPEPPRRDVRPADPGRLGWPYVAS